MTSSRSNAPAAATSLTTMIPHETERTARARTEVAEAEVDAALVYAGIGSRETPPNVLEAMTTLAAWLEAAGWRLHSGGADGADTAFENGTTTRRRTIYLPWKGYNGHAGPDAVTLSPQQQAEVQPKVAKYHGAWGRCSRGARALHGRNFAIIHGLTDQGADRTVDAVICWTPDGRTQGGTATGMKMARAAGIPVINLARTTAGDALETLGAIARRKAR